MVERSSRDRGRIVRTGEDLLPEGGHVVGPRNAVPLAIQQEPRGARHAGRRRAVDHQVIVAVQVDPVSGLERDSVGGRVVDGRLDLDGVADPVAD